MKLARLAVTAAALLSFAQPVLADTTPAPEDVEVYFVNLEDGATTSAPVHVVFGLRGMGVAPAGTNNAATGHHHVLIDRPPLGAGPEGPDELSQPLLANDNHLHFGGGQTETSLDLSPGQHTLQLVVGDQNHVPHDPPIVSEVITITVE